MIQLTLDDIETQLCARCERHLALEAFIPSRRGQRGTYCRSCQAEYKRERYGLRPRQWRMCAHPGCQARPSSNGALYCGPEHRALHPRKGQTSLVVNYRTAHIRVSRQRGAAGDHACAHGCGRMAAQWAYDHADPNEHHGPGGKGHLMHYSLDPMHYLPLCLPCHRQFDGTHAGRGTSIAAVVAWVKSEGTVRYSDVAARFAEMDVSSTLSQAVRTGRLTRLRRGVYA